MTKSKLKILILTAFYCMKNHTKLLWFMSFHTKPLLFQNLFALDETSHLISFGPKKYDAIYNRKIGIGIL